MIVDTHGIALRITPYSETSRIVSWLTPDHGRIATLAKGALRPKSLFLGQFDLFQTCELLYYFRDDREVFTLKECCPLTPRTRFRAHWAGAACASYLADLVGRLCPSRSPHPDVFEELEFALDLAATGNSPKAVLLSFELRLLAILGLAPQLRMCVTCRRKPPEGNGRFFFSVSRGGLLCGDCAARQSESAPGMPPDILGIMNFWLKAGDVRSAQRARCNREQLLAIQRLTGLLMEYHLDLKPDSRNLALEIIGKATELSTGR
ncbi:MAG: DNA repair protein RecO [Lentisphaerae bacterium]|nr:DNA repair protein RecO [Lentisphaerota bacterium]